MRWKGGRRSTNIEDRRGEPGGFGGGGRSFRIGGGKKKGGISIIIIAVVVLLMGGDPMAILNMLLGGAPVPTQQSSTQIPAPRTGEQKELADFVSVVLADTEDTWQPLFQQMGRQYQKPKLVLFSGGVRSACGMAQSAMGPFYCPADQKVYIDLQFYQELKHAFEAPGDFAQAYVIAHEVGHHVQQQFGVLQKVHEAQRSLSKPEANALSVKLELQADCLAGIWAHHANRERQVIEPGDIQEAMNAASQIGDDAIQKRSQGYVVPDSFTHGTSEQRMQWFMQGFKTGVVDQCNTFRG